MQVGTMLALARALVTAPAILLLDEATSSLDVVTEQAIEQNLPTGAGKPPSFMRGMRAPFLIWGP